MNIITIKIINAIIVLIIAAFHNEPGFIAAVASLIASVHAIAATNVATPCRIAEGFMKKQSVKNTAVIIKKY
jgi:hypothetical protein